MTSGVQETAKTALSQVQAEALCAEYGLTLETFDALAEKGTINSNFRLIASGARYFLRINEGKTKADVESEARLVTHLRARGLPTPRIIATRSGECAAWLGSKPITLFEWIDGREAESLSPGPKRAALIGDALAKLHLAGEAFSPCPQNHYSIATLKKRLDTFSSDPLFATVAPLLAEELNAAEERRRNLPSGLIHQDLFPDNVLVNADGTLAALIDFEQATYGPFIYDLAVAVNAWCWNGADFPRASIDAALLAYSAVRPISATEEKAFVGEARLASARFTLTRITDIFLRAGVAPELAARKDYRDYEKRLMFWRATS